MTKNQFIMVGVVVLLTIGGAYTQGRMTDRWSNEVSQRLEKFTTKLDGVPTQFGNWISEEMPVDEAQFKESNCHGRVSRLYKNTITGEQVNVFLVSGKGYHCTIHTPDYCYVAAGYETLKAPTNYSVDVPGVGKSEFLNAMFRKVTATETTQLRILWTYSKDGKWSAPKFAKYTLGNEPALYKIYLITQQTQDGRPVEQDPSVEFAKEFFPVLEQVLFTESVPVAESGAGPDDKVASN